MGESERVTVSLTKVEDLELAQRLSKEVEVKIVDFTLAGEPSKLNPLVPDMPTAIREIIRKAALQEAGYKWSNPAKEEGDDDSAKFLSGIVIGRDSSNQKIFRGNIKKAPAAVSELLRGPNHLAYNWYNVAYWDLGDFETLLQSVAPTGYLLIKGAGVLLFSDEVERLKNGEVVTPIYWGGLNELGIVEDMLDTYAVRDGKLYRVWAHLID